MTNYDEAVASILNEYDARYPTVTQEATANQSSYSTQPTKSRQLNPNCDSWRNLNVDDDVIMNGWPEEIPDRNVASLSIDGSHTKFDVCNIGRPIGIINMRNPYAIVAFKTHLGTAGHKKGILAPEDQ